MEPTHRNTLREDPLSKDDTMALRGMLVVLIIIFHCSFYYGFTFPDLGHIAVSMFLFFSGYGLELSLHRKKGYLKGFPSNRIFGILVQYWTIVLAIAIIGLLMYPGTDPIDRIASALFRTPHWFVVEILAFYVLFYLTGTLLRREGIRIAVTVICTFLLMFLMFRYYDSALYYLSGAGFALGIIWYHIRERVGTNRLIVMASIVLPLIVLILTDGRGDRGMQDMMEASVSCIASIVLVTGLQSVDLRRRWAVHLMTLILGIVLFLMTDIDREGASFIVFASLCSILTQMRISNKAFEFLGVMSFEMYLMHETFYLYVWNNIIHYEPLAFTVSLICAITASYAVYRISDRILKRMRETLSSEMETGS